MKKIPKFILVMFANQAFVGCSTLLIGKTFGSSHLTSFFTYLIRPLFLALTVYLFYAKSLAKIPSFLGFHKKFLQPLILGTLLTIPNGLLIVFLLKWKHVPFSFVFDEAFIHLVFIFLGPGLFEEGLFRGLVFRQFMEKHSWSKAGLYTGGFFAFFHLGNLSLGYSLNHVLFQLVHTFLMSLFVGYIVWKLNGNIWPSVAFHTIDNFYGATFITERDLQQHILSFSLLNIFGLVIAFAGAILLLHRKDGKRASLIMETR